jgi:hypothetical protein
MIKKMRKIRMKIKNNISLLLLLPFFVSCESPTGGSGTILSLDSNFTPIQNAEVILVLDNQNVDTVYTNNKGNFEIFFIASCATGCPDSKLLIRKNGFENKEYNITQEEDNNPKFDHDNIKVFLTPNK